MSNEANEISVDFQRKNLINDLHKNINAYLKECEINNRFKENVAGAVFDFLGGNHYEVFLPIYSNAAAFLLSAFGINKKIRKEFLMVVGEEEFDYLCGFLRDIIELCTAIRSNTANMAAMQKARLESGKYNHLTVDELEVEIIKYEDQLRLMQRINNPNKNAA